MGERGVFSSLPHATYVRMMSPVVRYPYVSVCGDFKHRLPYHCSSPLVQTLVAQWCGHGNRDWHTRTFRKPQNLDYLTKAIRTSFVTSFGDTDTCTQNKGQDVTLPLNFVLCVAYNFVSQRSGSNCCIERS